MTGPTRHWFGQMDAEGCGRRGEPGTELLQQQALVKSLQPDEEGAKH